MTNDTDLGLALRQAREARGLARRDLAELLGVSLGSVVRWELGGVPVTGAPTGLVRRFLDEPLPGDDARRGQVRKAFYRLGRKARGVLGKRAGFGQASARFAQTNWEAELARGWVKPEDKDLALNHWRRGFRDAAPPTTEETKEEPP